MTLNDLNVMQKADKYTQDGRDQIIDAGFEDGHISHRKDGDYIKQGGTWKPYTGGKGASGNNAEEKWQKNKNDFGRDRLSMKTRQGGQVHIYETENPNQKNARFRVDTGTHYFNTLEEAQAFAEKHWGPEEIESKGASEVETKYSPEEIKEQEKIIKELEQKRNTAVGFEKGKYGDELLKQKSKLARMNNYKDSITPGKQMYGLSELKATGTETKSATTGQNKRRSPNQNDWYDENGRQKTPYPHGWEEGDVDAAYEYEQRKHPGTHAVREDFERMAKTDPMQFKQWMDEVHEEESRIHAYDSAPRQLTGDTRLRLSQVKDRRYKPGEISEATGLQKQPDVQ